MRFFAFSIMAIIMPYFLPLIAQWQVSDAYYEWPEVQPKKRKKWLKRSAVLLLLVISLGAWHRWRTPKKTTSSDRHESASLSTGTASLVTSIPAAPPPPPCSLAKERRGTADIFPDNGPDPLAVEPVRITPAWQQWVSDHAGFVKELLDMGYRMSLIAAVLRAFLSSAPQPEQTESLPSETKGYDLSPKRKAAFVAALREYAISA